MSSKDRSRLACNALKVRVTNNAKHYAAVAQAIAPQGRHGLVAILAYDRNRYHSFVLRYTVPCAVSNTLLTMWAIVIVLMLK